MTGAAARLLRGFAACLLLGLLAVPLGTRAGAAATALRFLAEFLTEGRLAWLSADTRPPTRRTMALTGDSAGDLWRSTRTPPHPGVVLVHGLTPEGKDDPRLAAAAALLARGGLAVMVPDLPAMRSQRLRPTDADAVAAAVRALAATPGVPGLEISILAISVGTGPVFAALRDSEIQARVDRVVGLGGYAEARELVRYFTTGSYAFRGISGRVRFDPALAREFLALNLDLVRDPQERALVRGALAGRPLPPEAGGEARAVLAVLANQDPARVDALLEALPAETRALLDALSPARHAGRVRSRLVLVHGRDDPAIPYTESLRLAAAADPGRTRLVLVNLLAHVEGRSPAWRQLGDALRLWGAAYELFRG
jgi:pimeloyl-ACP methyl ester carboxylesterase